MPETNTYDAIQSYTLTSNNNTITFGSIPQTYTDLIIVTNNFAPNSTAGNVTYIFNSNSSSGLYSRTTLYGDGTTVASTRGTGSNEAYAGVNPQTMASSIIHIFNYTNTTTHKTSIAIGSSANNETIMRVNLWRNTNAITSITINTDNGSTYASGSMFSLYGIKAA